MSFIRTAFAAALSVLAASPALAEPPPSDAPFDAGGKFFMTLPQSTGDIRVSHALALACTPGAHHIAARLVMFVDQTSLAVAFPDEAAQTKFLEQTRFRAQSALRAFSKGSHLNWPVAFNQQLDILSQEITKTSHVLLMMTVNEKDLVPFTSPAPCAKLFDAPLTVTWPIIQELDTRKQRPRMRPLPLPFRRPEMAV